MVALEENYKKAEESGKYTKPQLMSVKQKIEISREKLEEKKERILKNAPVISKTRELTKQQHEYSDLLKNLEVPKRPQVKKQTSNKKIQKKLRK